MKTMGEMTGLFVVFEGIDGSGKSTQIPLVAEELRKEGLNVYTTSEPSSGKLGPILRDYLSNTNSHPAVDALLFAADRVDHYTNEIQPKLSDHYIVISDRYKASSLIYQGSSGLSDSWILEINSQVRDPDLTIYLDITADEALRRLNDSNRDYLEKFEKNDTLSYLLKRYDELEIANKVNIDASLSIPKITKQIVDVIKKYHRSQVGSRKLNQH